MKTNYPILFKTGSFPIIILIIFLYVWFIPANSVQAANFSVSTAADLNQAIIAANNNSEADTITLSNTIVLTGTLEKVTSEIIIDGNGYTLSGNNFYRVLDVSTLGKLTIDNLTIANGSVVDQQGGGIRNLGTLEARNCTFTQNSVAEVTTEPDGGALYNNGIAIISNCTFSENHSPYDGGGIYNHDGVITVTNTIFSDNSALYGAGLINWSLEDNSIINSTFSGNIATTHGGGLRNNGNLTLSNNTYANNSAYKGGGVYNGIDGILTVLNSTFSGNISNQGGGLYNNTQLGPNIISDCTFYNNTATENGGGIRNDGGLELNHNLISGNSSPQGAEYYQANNGEAATIADNYNVFAHSELTDEKAFSNFIPGSSDYSAASNSNNILITNILNTELAPNGGPTLTHALVAGSPAVDSYTDTPSNCPLTDQRGVERPWPNNGDCDSGAYEMQYLNLTVNSENGTVLINPDWKTIEFGDVISLTAIANPHWQFTGWSGDLTSTDNPLIFTMTEDLTVTANYSQIHFSLSVSEIGEGIIDIDPVSPFGDGYYPPGELVTLTAIANPGWNFSNWSGDVSSFTNPFAVIVDDDISITALFTQNEYELEISSDHGTVVRDPEKDTYHYGDVVTLTADPEPGWVFKRWSGDLNSIENPVSLTIYDNLNIVAEFEKLKIFLPFVTK